MMTISPIDFFSSKPYPLVFSLLRVTGNACFLGLSGKDPGYFPFFFFFGFSPLRWFLAGFSVLGAFPSSLSQHDPRKKVISPLSFFYRLPPPIFVFFFLAGGRR